MIYRPGFELVPDAIRGNGREMTCNYTAPDELAERGRLLGAVAVWDDMAECRNDEAGLRTQLVVASLGLEGFTAKRLPLTTSGDEVLVGVPTSQQTRLGFFTRVVSHKWQSVGLTVRAGEYPGEALQTKIYEGFVAEEVIKDGQGHHYGAPHDKWFKQLGMLPDSRPYIDHGLAPNMLRKSSNMVSSRLNVDVTFSNNRRDDLQIALDQPIVVRPRAETLDSDNPVHFQVHAYDSRHMDVPDALHSHNAALNGVHTDVQKHANEEMVDAWLLPRALGGLLGAFQVRVVADYLIPDARS